MINYILLIPILVSFFVTMFLLPNWIKRARKAGLVGMDVNKINKVEVAEAGGVTVVAGFALGILVYISINTFAFRNEKNLIEIFALMSSILLIAFIAFTDDILGWKIGLRRRTRLVLVAFASVPLIAINAGKSGMSLPLIGPVDMGIIYPLFLIPLGIVGATTTFNFLAGFNGLEAGQGVLILSAMAVVAYATGNSWLALIALCIVASLLAFLLFNFYPARVFPGDSLTYPVGAMIAIMAILGNFEKIAVFFFIPYILETVLKSKGRLIKQSFAKPMEDGSLDLKYDKIYSLNHVAIYLMKRFKIRPTERRVVTSIYMFQIIIILVGFLIFRGGILS